MLRTAAALAMLIPGAAHAQLAVDKVELLFDPTVARQRTGVFTVTNNGKTTVQATLSLNDWDRDESGENRFYPIGGGPGSCGRAITITPAAMLLAPGSTQDVRVSLDSAALSAAAGRECWSIAFLETTLPPDSASGRVLNYVVRTGVKLYAGTPQLKADGEITTMRIARRPAQAPAPTADAGPDDISIVVKNTGTRHTKANGTVEFRRPDNSLAATVAVPDVYMLPGASVRVSVPGPKLAPGRYVVLAVMDYHGDDLAAAQMEYEVP